MRDPDGRPLAGAVLQLSAGVESLPEFPYALQGRPLGRRTATSDARGRFLLADVPRVEGLKVHASLEGYRDASRPVPLALSLIHI